MYEYHGWITVRAFYENKEHENEDEILNKIVDQIRNHIIELNWGHGVLDIRAINAEYHIWTSGYHNHKPMEQDTPVEFFKYVGMLAPGSYGILYVRDDYDMVDGNYNKFKAYVLAQGKLQEHSDPFLSPFVPTAESFPMD
jgi:hypothetical protein